MFTFSHNNSNGLQTTEFFKIHKFKMIIIIRTIHIICIMPFLCFKSWNKNPLYANYFHSMKWISFIWRCGCRINRLESFKLKEPQNCQPENVSSPLLAKSTFGFNWSKDCGDKRNNDLCYDNKTCSLFKKIGWLWFAHVLKV